MTVTKDIPKTLRVDDADWQAGITRAKAEGHTLSLLIRQWIKDYVATGSPVADGQRPQIRLTAAERKLAVEAIKYEFVAERLLDAAVRQINAERS